MSRDQRGTKRVCRSCGARFYDLNRSPIVCPVCETVYHAAPAPARRTTERSVKAPREEPKRAEASKEKAEVISLEDAEEPAAANVDDEDIAGIEDAEDDEDVGGDGDDVFLEEEDEENGDVSDIVRDRDDESDR